MIKLICYLIFVFIPSILLCQRGFDLEPYYPKPIQGFVIDSIIDADAKHMHRYSYTNDGLIKSKDFFSRETQSDEFEFIHRENRTYDNLGKMTELSEPGFQLNRTYDNQGNCVLEKRQELDFSRRVILIERLFNNQNKLLSEISSFGNPDTTKKSTARFFSYDKNGNMLDWIDAKWKDSVFVNSWRESYTYDSLNRKKTWRQQLWDDTSWYHGGYWDVYYYYPNDSLFEVVTEGLGPGLFGPLSKTTYEYDDNWNKIKSSNYSISDTGWVLGSYITSRYDFKNRLINKTSVRLFGDSSNIDSEYTINYNDSLIIEESVYKKEINDTLQIQWSKESHFDTNNNRFLFFVLRSFYGRELIIIDTLQIIYDDYENLQTVIVTEWNYYDKYWRRLEYDDLRIASKIIDYNNNIFCHPNIYDGYDNDYQEFNGIKIFWKQFVTNATEPHHTGFTLSYPNPFETLTTIKFNLENSSNVKIDIYDWLGNKLLTLKNEYMHAGINEVQMTSDDLNTGTYFYRIVTRDKTESGKLIIIK